MPITVCRTFLSRKIFLNFSGMGVKDLWQIIDPCKEQISLEDLKDQRLAIDLGFWVCELQAAVTNALVSKPHLR